MTVINMQTMRYINLFDRITRIKTHNCFVYNNAIVFAVPSDLMSKAIGTSGRNIREIQDTLGRKIKVIKEARGIEDIERFVRDIVEPAGFKSLEIQGDEAIITAGGQYKAALIGRNKARLLELSAIVYDLFGKQIKIV